MQEHFSSYIRRAVYALSVIALCALVEACHGGSDRKEQVAPSPTASQSRPSAQQIIQSCHEVILSEVIAESTDITFLSNTDPIEVKGAALVTFQLSGKFREGRQAAQNYRCSASLPEPSSELYAEVDIE